MSYPPTGPPSGSYSTAPPPPSQTTMAVPTLGGFLTMGGGLLALISGLLTWYSAGDLAVAGFNRILGLTWLVPVCGILLLGVACIRVFLPAVPRAVLTFSWEQIGAAIALVATVVVLNALIVQARGELGFGPGIWLAALAVTAALIGTALELLGLNPTLTTVPTATAPPGPAAPAPGYGPPSGYPSAPGYPPPPVDPPAGGEPAPGFKPPPGYDGR